MEMLEIEIVEVELKYCERCGGLWVRPVGSDRVLCGSCAEKMAEIELPAKSFRVQMPIDDGKTFEATLEDLLALCGEGGNA
jgi:Zn-finger nucleic acid-binding protein